MLRVFIGLLFAFAIAGCSHQPAKQKPAAEEKFAEIKRSILPPQEAASYQLSHTKPRLWLEDYRFGKFFQDRAEFFVIENSESKIFGSSVTKIILYYLDGNHCQSKFFLAEDITNQAIARYGKFSITPLDQQNKDTMEQQPILYSKNGIAGINPALTRYELKWRLQERNIILRMDSENPYERIVYTEQVPDYHRLYMEMELANL